jgi:hypothetical protein
MSPRGTHFIIANFFYEAAFEGNILEYKHRSTDRNLAIACNIFLLLLLLSSLWLTVVQALFLKCYAVIILLYARVVFWCIFCSCVGVFFCAVSS